MTAKETNNRAYYKTEISGKEMSTADGKKINNQNLTFANLLKKKKKAVPVLLMVLNFPIESVVLKTAHVQFLVKLTTYEKTHHMLRHFP